MAERTTGDPLGASAPSGAPPAETGPAERALASAFRTAFGALRVVMVIVLVALLFSNTRFLQQNQRAVVLRFGRVVGTGAARVRGPGLVFAWPQPIDEIIVVEAGRINTLELDTFMYRKEAREELGGTASLGPTLEPGRDGYTLTGDANMIHTIWRVQYQIDDVVAYALRVAEPEALIEQALAAEVVRTCAEFTVDEALWTDVEELRRRVQHRLQARLDEAGTGIEVTRASVVRREHPKQTDVAFNEVARAAQDVSQKKSGALGYRDTLLAGVAGDAGRELARVLGELAAAEEAPPAERDEAAIAALREEVSQLLARAGGEVSDILTTAETYKTEVVVDARSMAETFQELLDKYRENPEVFIRQTYQNTIEDVLSRAGVKFVLYARERDRWIYIEPREKKPEEEEAPVVEKTPEERRRERLTGF